jgi:predicted anti-sigma-YlaC factor YlaD
MNCKKVRPLLSPYLDNELSDKERLTVRDHLNGCSGCSQVLEDFKRLRQLLVLKKQRTMKPFLWSRIAAEIRESGRQQPWIAQIHTPWLGRAAAFLLAVLLVGSFLFIGLKIIPNGHAESAQLAESNSDQTGQNDITSPGLVRDASQLSKDSVLSIILFDNSEADNK